MFGLFERQGLTRQERSTALCDALAERSDPLYSHLSLAERETLASLAVRFVDSRSIVGAGGLEVDDTMREQVALDACLPIVHLGLDAYDRARTVILYPSGFVVDESWTDEIGIVHEGPQTFSGSATDLGPVVLAWDDLTHPAPDQNVVIHEFAHVLDALNGDTNGFPPVLDRDTRQAWPRVFAAAYDDLQRRLEAADDAPLPMDPYAAENPAECFAVAFETFFVNPWRLAEGYPDVFRLLADYTGQDPRRSVGSFAA